MYQTKRQKYEVLRAQLESERSTFVAHYRDLNDYILPRRARFFVSDANKGDRRNQKIIDSTATMAARTLRAGMMSGVTSPARPWFKLATPDPELNEFASVKDWLHDVSLRMSSVFLRSNLYNVLPMVYGDIGVFATAPMSIEEDFTGDVIHTQSFPVGSYMIGKDYRGRVNTFIRDFRMTVRQLVEQFGQVDENGKPDWSKFSMFVKNSWDRGEYETWVDVCHVLKPNEEFDPNKVEAKYKRFSSCYFERGTQGGDQGYMGADADRFLSESGYDYFPVLCPRWEVTGEDVYGTDCPGMTALGDIKALQLMHKRKAEAIEKMVKPPMTGPTSLRNSKASILPGDITYVDVREGQQGFRTAHEVQMSIQELLLDVDAHQKRIQRAFYEDLFLMLATSDRRQITAREIEERHEEKLLAIGPVLEQLNQDLLDPLVDNTFDIMVRQNPIPPAPEELQGMKLKVEYTSIMAQAQKLVGVGGLERFAGMFQNAAASDPSGQILKKVNLNKYLDVYGDTLSIPPGILRTEEEVAEMVAAEQQALKQQQAQQQIVDGAKAAKELSQASMEGDTALTRMVGQMGGGQ